MRGVIERIIFGRAISQIPTDVWKILENFYLYHQYVSLPWNHVNEMPFGAAAYRLRTGATMLLFLFLELCYILDQILELA